MDRVAKGAREARLDTLINSHWESGTKAHLTVFRGCLEDLSATVSAGIKAGNGKKELQPSIKIEKYSGYVGYPDQVPHVVGSAYDNLMRYRN